jgi:hypothetical protein
MALGTYVAFVMMLHNPRINLARHAYAIWPMNQTRRDIIRLCVAFDA